MSPQSSGLNNNFSISANLNTEIKTALELAALAKEILHTARKARYVVKKNGTFVAPQITPDSFAGLTEKHSDPVVIYANAVNLLSKMYFANQVNVGKGIIDGTHKPPKERSLGRKPANGFIYAANELLGYAASIAKEKGYGHIANLMRSAKVHVIGGEDQTPQVTALKLAFNIIEDGPAVTDACFESLATVMAHAGAPEELLKTRPGGIPYAKGQRPMIQNRQ